MTHDALSERSIVLRLEFSIADAVHQRGLISVLRAAILAWWNRPRIGSAAHLSPRLLADIGLPADTAPTYWPEPSANPQVPPPLWRPGL